MSPRLLLFLPSLFLLVTAKEATALPINITRLTSHLTTLATHNDLAPPSVQRILYTPVDVSSRAYLKSIFEEAGLKIHDDPLGNMFATWYPEKGPGILTGSHFDAIPHSGMYDGTLGILSALEAITSLNESGFVPNRSITILAFTSEEPTRFGLSCIGSRVLSGTLPPQNLSDLSDIQGTPFHAARASAGYTDDVRKVPLEKGAYTAFVELHSEQGPLLENSHTDIGAVTSIAAPAAMSVKFTGPGGHAGTTLMPERKDPSLAAAELSLVVEAVTRKFGTVDTVATSGYVSIAPNAINSVPTEAKLGIDVRDIDEKRRDRVLDVIESAANIIAKNRGVGIEVVVNSRDPPAGCDNQVIHAVMSVAKEQGMKVTKMVSRAYHDALFMAQVMPTGMIFVPCRGGISHRPDEFVSQRDMENGVRVLAGVLRQLAGGADRRDNDHVGKGMGVINESSEKVGEILNAAQGQDANIENATIDEEDEELESRESGTGRQPRSTQRKIRKSGEPTATKLAKEKARDPAEMESRNARDRNSGTKNGAKRAEYGNQGIGRPDDGKVSTSAKPKMRKSWKPGATKVDEPEVKESAKKLEETGSPNVRYTITPLEDAKRTEIGEENGISDDGGMTTFAKPTIGRSGSSQPESIKFHGSRTRESGEKESRHTGDRKATEPDSDVEVSGREQDAEESGNGRRIRSTRRKKRNLRNQVVTKNRDPIVMNPERNVTLNSGRNGTEPSTSQKNDFVEGKDEV